MDHWVDPQDEKKYEFGWEVADLVDSSEHCVTVRPAPLSHAEMSYNSPKWLSTNCHLHPALKKAFEWYLGWATYGPQPRRLTFWEHLEE